MKNVESGAARQGVTVSMVVPVETQDGLRAVAAFYGVSQGQLVAWWLDAEIDALQGQLAPAEFEELAALRQRRHGPPPRKEGGALVLPPGRAGQVRGRSSVPPLDDWDF